MAWLQQFGRTENLVRRGALAGLLAAAALSGLACGPLPEGNSAAVLDDLLAAHAGNSAAPGAPDSNAADGSQNSLLPSPLQGQWLGKLVQSGYSTVFAADGSQRTDAFGRGQEKEVALSFDSAGLPASLPVDEGFALTPLPPPRLVQLRRPGETESFPWSVTLSDGAPVAGTKTITVRESRYDPNEMSVVLDIVSQGVLQDNAAEQTGEPVILEVNERRAYTATFESGALHYREESEMRFRLGSTTSTTSALIVGVYEGVLVRP